MMQRVLVIGAERLTQLLDWAKRDTAVLFGDGAGAVIIEASEQESGLIASKLGCDSEAREILHVPNFGTDRVRFADIDGLFTFNFEGRRSSSAPCAAWAKPPAPYWPRPASPPSRSTSSCRTRRTCASSRPWPSGMNAPMEKVMVNIEQYGNTSAATVPIALCEALEQGRVKPNSYLLTAAFGAGLTWGAALIKWGDRVTPIARVRRGAAPASRAPSNSSPMRCRVASRPARRRLSERQRPPMIRQEPRGSWQPAPTSPRRFGSDIKVIEKCEF